MIVYSRKRGYAMTERIYFEDAYVSSFDAVVTACEKHGDSYGITLDRSAFFPEGGGQPGDTGKIGSCIITDTIECNGSPLHISNEFIEKGTAVSCEIDFDKRFFNMQQHTGEHIFSGILNRLTGFDNVGFHMGSEFVTVDFNGKVNEETLKECEKLANKAIYADRPVKAFFPSPDELKDIPYRSKKEIDGDVRLVEIPGCDICACCGTHLSSTGQVGMVKATAMINYKSGVRITLMIGERALDDYSRKNESTREICNLLSAGEYETDTAVRKLCEKEDALKEQIVSLKKQIISLKADGYGRIVFDSTLEGEDIFHLCNALGEKYASAAVFCGDDGSGYKYAITSTECDLGAFCKEFNAALSGRGGGRGNMVRGSAQAGEKEIREFLSEKDIFKEN